MSRRGWILFLAMAVIWGIPYLLIKVAVADLSPVSVVFLRTAIAAALLVPLAAARGELSPLLARWRPIALYTLVEVAVPWLLLPTAEQRMTSSLAGLLIAAVPLIAAVLGLLTRGDERLDARRVAGLVVGFAGVAALLGLDVSQVDARAVGEVGLVAVGYAIGPMIVARRLSDVPALGVVAASVALTAAAYAPAGLAWLPARLPPPQVLAAVAVLGVVCTALAFVLFFALIAEAGPLRAQAITYVNPAVALGLGVALLGEPFTAGIVVGLAMIVIGVLLANGLRPRPLRTRSRAAIRDW
jgi:drug/metabolite transporter (DMT)-like permease